MTVFYILLLIPMLAQHFTIKGYRHSYEKKNQHILAFFFILLTFLVMFRHESVGNDTRNYIRYFYKFASVPWSDLGRYATEFGFAYFGKATTMFSENPQFFLAMSAIVVSAMIYPTYKRLCVDVSLTIVLFCTMSTFVMMFSGIRQMLAVGIGLFAYECTRKKQILPFLLAVLLSMLMHASGFMVLLMYPLYHAKITKRWLLAVIPALAVVFVFNKQIFTVLGLFLERYTEYDASISQTGAYAMMILFSAFAVFSFLIPEESLLDEEIIGLRNFLLLSLVVQMFAPLHTIAMRMNYYYIIFIPLLIPKIIQYRSRRWNQIALMGRHVMVAFFFVYFFINANGSDNLHVFPYHFCWETIG